jgi:hypothetical protein
MKICLLLLLRDQLKIIPRKGRLKLLANDVLAQLSKSLRFLRRSQDTFNGFLTVAASAQGPAGRIGSLTPRPCWPEAEIEPDCLLPACFQLPAGSLSDGMACSHSTTSGRVIATFRRKGS